MAGIGNLRVVGVPLVELVVVVRMVEMVLVERNLEGSVVAVLEDTGIYPDDIAAARLLKVSDQSIVAECWVVSKDRDSGCLHWKQFR